MIVQQVVSSKLGVYVASIQLGDSVEDDIRNTFTVTMDRQVEMFTQRVREVTSWFCSLQCTICCGH